jgi:hypothetical protein
MVYELHSVHNFSLKKEENPIKTGVCDNFTGLWGKVPHKDQRKST